MFRSCWDCIGGNDLVRERIPAEDQYGTRLNGEIHSFSPAPWPKEDGDNMFLLPRSLSPLDTVIIEAEIQPNPRIITASLLTANIDNWPDYKNTVCQVEMNFPGTSENQNKLFLKTIQNENVLAEENENSTTQYISDSNLKISFIPRSSTEMEIFLGDTYVQMVLLRHDLSIIRYINVKGDIAKVNALDFKFA